jgi:hypothetical protein
MMTAIHSEYSCTAPEYFGKRPGIPRKSATTQV